MAAWCWRPWDSKFVKPCSLAKILLPRAQSAVLVMPLGHPYLSDAARLSGPARRTAGAGAGLPNGANPQRRSAPGIGRAPEPGGRQVCRERCRRVSTDCPKRQRPPRMDLRLGRTSRTLLYSGTTGYTSGAGNLCPTSRCRCTKPLSRNAGPTPCTGKSSFAPLRIFARFGQLVQCFVSQVCDSRHGARLWRRAPPAAAADRRRDARGRSSSCRGLGSRAGVDLDQVIPV